MTKSDYTRTDMGAVSDTPELTAADIAEARPFAEAFPELAAKMRRGRPAKIDRKVSTTIRLSPEVIAHFKAEGKGWQSRIDDALRKLISTP